MHTPIFPSELTLQSTHISRVHSFFCVIRNNEASLHVVTTVMRSADNLSISKMSRRMFGFVESLQTSRMTFSKALSRFTRYPMPVHSGKAVRLVISRLPASHGFHNTNNNNIITISTVDTVQQLFPIRKYWKTRVQFFLFSTCATCSSKTFPFARTHQHQPTAH